MELILLLLISCKCIGFRLLGLKLKLFVGIAQNAVENPAPHIDIPIHLLYQLIAFRKNIIHSQSLELISQEPSQ
jgi:hypothetical protein